MKTIALWIVLWSAPLVGCATMKQSDTSRTGLEQLLISNAVDRSLDKVDFRPIAGAKVHVKTELLDCVDKNYIILATKSRLLASQCTVADKAEDADVIVELASGGHGGSARRPRQPQSIDPIGRKRGGDQRPARTVDSVASSASRAGG